MMARLMRHLTAAGLPAPFVSSSWVSCWPREILIDRWRGARLRGLDAQRPHDPGNGVGVADQLFIIDVPASKHFSCERFASHDQSGGLLDQQNVPLLQWAGCCYLVA